MAQSFWSKRRSSAEAAGNYLKATDSVSRPTALIITILGILLVGGLLFGVFSGVRWAYTRLTNDSDTVATTSTSGPTNSGDNRPAASQPPAPTPQTPPSSGSITATSSTTTTTPSSPQASTTTTTPSRVPNTGPTENYIALFSLVAVTAYFVLRRRSLHL